MIPIPSILRGPRLSGAARFTASVLAAFAVLLTSGAALAETRIALIIANGRYASTTPLTNPASDAHLVEAALKKTGFDKVTVLEDLGRNAMNRALQEFGNDADHADVALVYYAGHGVEVDNVNYLLPIDVVFAHDRDVDIEAVKLDTMLAVTENAKRLRMVIIDACRDNPFAEKIKKSMAGAASKGMAAVEPSKNSLVVYSAKAGTLASDGRVNSPFAEALAKRIVEPGREISLLLRQVRDDVLDRTGGKQEPFTYGSLSSQEFYFIPPVAVAVAPLVPVIDIETETWALCKTSLSRGPCDAYLTSYAGGRFAALVQTRVADITHSATSAAASMAANVAAARAASIAATNAANLAATYAATLAASSPGAVAPGIPAVESSAASSVGIAARSTTLGAAGVSSAPSAAPIIVASLGPPSAPVIVASRPPAAPVVLASLGPIIVPPYAASAGTAGDTRPPAGFAAARVGDLGITVRYDAGGKGILVESVERTALVSGKLFIGDVITRIGAAVPDAAQPPDTQLAADWKSDGRLKLLVKRGDAISVVIIRGSN